MENMVNFWKGKKVFITGHTGFKGSWLSLWLQELQVDLCGYALSPPATANIFTAARVADRMVDLRNDICDYKKLSNAINQFQPEIVFHLAAQSLVRYSYSNPTETYQTNVMGTVNLLEAIRHTKSIRAVINITSDKCYENKNTDYQYQEQDALGGYDPYSNSKACSELITNAFRNSYLKEQGIGIATVRAGNVIGGGDWALDRLIPDVITSCVEQKNLIIRYPEAIRPWQHVLEPLSGYLKLAMHLYDTPELFSEAWNFGPTEKGQSVEWIVKEIIKKWNAPIKWQKKAESLHETKLLNLDSSKAHTKLNWKPKWDIAKTLQNTIDWYKAYYEKTNMHQYSLNQITSYRM